jgi:hypothetical protein
MTTDPPTALPDAAAASHRPFPDPIGVVPWIDRLVDAVGFPPHHAYVELVWLPVLGPSSTWIYRRLAELVRRRPVGAEIHLAVLARAVGLGPAVVGHHSPVQLSLRRIVRFGLAESHGRHLAIRTTAPPLGQRQLAQLPDELQAVHRRLVAARRQPQVRTP